MTAIKKFKKGDRVKVTINNEYVYSGQTGEVTDAELINPGAKEFWWYAVRLDSPISGSAPSYMFLGDAIKKI
jgi:hypothetical protein